MTDTTVNTHVYFFQGPIRGFDTSGLSSTHNTTGSLNSGESLTDGGYLSEALFIVVYKVRRVKILITT